MRGGKFQVLSDKFQENPAGHQVSFEVPTVLILET